jgi:hypothetical protein
MPAAFARGRRVLEDAAKQSKRQRDGVIRNLVEAIVGNVGDDYAILISSLYVDNVDADPVPTDRLAALELRDRLARNTGVLLENDVRIDGLLGILGLCGIAVR